MRRLTNNHTLRCVVVLLLLTTLLTFSVGRVEPVEAVATTAAIVGEVLLGLGVTYIAYQTLTGANVYVPGYEETDMYEYIRDLGRDFSQSASGSRLFSYLYDKLIVDDTYSVVDFTQDRLRDIYNDHKDISSLQNVSSYIYQGDVSQIPTNGFEYAIAPTTIPFVNANGENINPISVDYGIGVQIYTLVNGHATILTTWNEGEFRNIKTSSGLYRIQQNVNGTWTIVNPHFDASVRMHFEGGSTYWYCPNVGSQYWFWSNSAVVDLPSTSTYPLLPNAVIYDEVTGETTSLVPVSADNTQLTPQYPQNDDGENKFPIVPYVELPSTQKWGFNWRDALVDLINGGSRLITYQWLADLINDFKNSLSGTAADVDYNYFNEGDTYYVTYYTNTVNDINNPIYNINVSEQEDVIPVDLNTVQQYTDNDYLEVVKQSAVDYGNTIGQWFVFWHNSDVALLYTILGSAIVILLGAFIGKWGHS